ncbi:Ser-Thr-rich glycosyl-phosphatidyl-inositol-anchored membrane family-domain-containing protein [Aspergillus multicolor]|uniref:GPI anchored serine-threonine rich family protein n=1 Tax=Aspergillus multicolor TaxID=41759 RepID=UPI003CCD4E02
MQLTSTLSLFLAFAISALAMTITSPGTTNQKVDFSKPFTIKWGTVNGDPDQFTITLVNMDGHRVNKDLAKDVDASKEEYRVEKVADIPVANNYQINFRSTEKENVGILAQSPRFNVTKVADDDDETTTTTATATATATRTQSQAEATETDDTNGADHVKGVYAASGAVAGVMALVVMAL